MYRHDIAYIVWVNFVMLSLGYAYIKFDFDDFWPVISGVAGIVRQRTDTMDIFLGMAWEVVVEDVPAIAKERESE